MKNYSDKFASAVENICPEGYKSWSCIEEFYGEGKEVSKSFLIVLYKEDELDEGMFMAKRYSTKKIRVCVDEIKNRIESLLNIKSI